MRNLVIMVCSAVATGVFMAFAYIWLDKHGFSTLYTILIVAVGGATFSLCISYLINRYWSVLVELGKKFLK